VYNSTEEVRALKFIKEQIGAGIKPDVKHFSGKEFADRKFADRKFADRKFAVMLEGTWLLAFFPAISGLV
jgi:multiple sugar transport system substrate-binding protein